jgi:hypothetical protein
MNDRVISHCLRNLYSCVPGTAVYMHLGDLHGKISVMTIFGRNTNPNPRALPVTKSTNLKLARKYNKLQVQISCEQNEPVTFF